MSEQTTPKPDIDSQLRIFRERSAAIVALAIVVGSFIMIGLAMSLVSKPNEFDLAKDLLLFINPILGVAIGYFFNKVTSDARAETAEKAASNASQTAEQANRQRDEALVEAAHMRDETENMHAVLEDLSGCAENMLDQMDEGEVVKSPGTLRGSEGAQFHPPDALRAQIELRAALNRAQKWMQR